MCMSIVLLGMRACSFVYSMYILCELMSTKALLDFNNHIVFFTNSWRSVLFSLDKASKWMTFHLNGDWWLIFLLSATWA